MFDGIIDLNHNDAIDFDQVKAAGITAIIHKATEGATVQDDKYRTRRDQAKAMGCFLWGTYHFATNADVGDQVNNLLTWAEPGDTDFIALDFEPNKTRHGVNITMSFAQAEDFVQRIHAKLGRWPVIYGGGDLLGTQAPMHPDTVLVNCPLWYANYQAIATPPIPAPWTAYTLWQYTDGNSGNEPRTTPGATCDRNVFAGTADALAAAWPF